MKKILILVVVLAVLGGAFAGAQVFVNKLAEARVDATIAGIQGFAGMEYGKARINLLNGSAIVEGISIANKKSGIQADQFVLHSCKWGLGGPSAHHFEIKGIKPKSPDGAGWKFAGPHAADQSFDFECDYTYDEEAKSLELKTVKISGEGAGDLDIGLTLENFKPTLVGLALFSKKNLPNARLVNAHATYVDDSLITNLMAKRAEEMGKTPEEFKAKISGDMQKSIDMETSESAVAIMKQLQKFINNPERFEIIMQPPQPITFSALGDEKDQEKKIALLGLEVNS